MGTGQPCSHFAILFSDDLIFQSNLLGTGVEFAPDFFKNQTVIHEIEIPLDDAVETKVRRQALAEFSGKGYDYGAFIFDIWRMILHRIFGMKIGTKNLWGQNDKFLCVGLAKCLDQDGMPLWVRLAVQRVPDFDVYFPEDLFHYLEASRGN
jgi:hypothetical protein